jgi:hypothetical protein
MEPISTAALAALIIASRSGAEELGKEAGHSAWSGLSRLRTLVQGKFRGNAAASQAFAAAEQNPANDAAIAQLRDSIEVYAREDGVFAAELRRLVDEARPRPEYQWNSSLFANYGYVGKLTHFAGPVSVQGDFTIN